MASVVLAPGERAPGSYASACARQAENEQLKKKCEDLQSKLDDLQKKVRPHVFLCSRRLLGARPAAQHMRCIPCVPVDRQISLPQMDEGGGDGA